MTAKWKIFYENGYAIDSEEAEPHLTPVFGFVCAVGYEKSGRRYIMHGWDFYRFDRESQQWWGMDQWGKEDRLIHGREIYAYKIGRTVAREQFEMLMRLANDDVEFQRR